MEILITNRLYIEKFYETKKDILCQWKFNLARKYNYINMYAPNNDFIKTDEAKADSLKGETDSSPIMGRASAIPTFLNNR